MHCDYLIVDDFGIFEIMANDEYLISLNVVLKAKTPNPNQITNKAKNQLLMYFQKKLFRFDLPLDLSSLSKFTQNALNGLLQIDYGKTISYKDLAKIAGNEKAFRAIGNAIGKNPYLIILPCHRVIKSDKSIGGFSCVDKSIKQKLIELEKSNS